MKKIYTILSIACLVGCNPIYYPADIHNWYFDEIYVSDYANESDAKTTIRPIEDGLRYDLASQSRMLFSPAKIEFYKDKYQKCFLYAYSKEELKELKTSAGFSLNSSDAVYLTEKTGLRVISTKEYERIKSALKLHQYDASLCKPKSNDD